MAKRCTRLTIPYVSTIGLFCSDGNMMHVETFPMIIITAGGEHMYNLCIVTVSWRYCFTIWPHTQWLLSQDYQLGRMCCPNGLIWIYSCKLKLRHILQSEPHSINTHTIFVPRPGPCHRSDSRHWRKRDLIYTRRYNRRATLHNCIGKLEAVRYCLHYIRLFWLKGQQKRLMCGKVKGDVDDSYHRHASSGIIITWCFPTSHPTSDLGTSD